MMLLEGFVVGVIFLLTPGVRCEETEVIAEAGSQAVLPCKCGIQQCDPAAITWSKIGRGTVWRKQSSGLQHWGSSWMLRGNQRVKCPHSEYVRGDYSLRINSVRVEDGGVYSCRVEIKNHVTQVHVMLRIIQVSVSLQAPVWGESVSATCSLTPWPKGAHLRWMLNNRPYWAGSPSNNYGKVVKENMTDKLAGNWTCIYRGMTEGRATATLSVRGIIQPAKDDAKVYAAVGSSVTLPCVFSPGLNPTSTVLEKMDVRKNLTFDNNPHLPSSDKFVTIQEVTLEDKGKYKCSGTVGQRRQSRTMQLVVAKIVQSNQRGSVTLTCQLSDTSEVTEYKWVHVTYDLNGTKSEGPFLKGQTIYPKENQGEWTCYYGKNGILGNVTTHVLLMSGQSGQAPSGSSNTATVIGLSFLLAILLLILAQMYKNHQRRKRILQYPALETVVHTISNEREERERERSQEKM